MRIPTIRGIIDRRILVNYRIDPGVMAQNLPEPFRPVLVNGYAMGGICLIRLKKIRPAIIPWGCGIQSENAAHRIAVRWEQNGHSRQGVYIPRRDTNSRLNALAGGRVFPGMHHFARFTTQESNGDYKVEMRSDDGRTHVGVSGGISQQFPDSSIFKSLDQASSFFEQGSIGYSTTQTAGRYDGLELHCKNWRVDCLDVDHVESSYFDDRNRFRTGAVAFDCALLMRHVEHEWQSIEPMCCTNEI